MAAVQSTRSSFSPLAHALAEQLSGTTRLEDLNSALADVVALLPHPTSDDRLYFLLRLFHEQYRAVLDVLMDEQATLLAQVREAVPHAV